MSRSIYAPHMPTLRAIIEDTGVESLTQITRRPGVGDVYRLAIFRHDGQARDSVATIIQRGRDDIRLELTHRAALNRRALVYAIPFRRYEPFVAALQSIRFDQLRDQPDLPLYSIDLWLMERAAGSFTRGVIVAPALATDAYAILVDAMRQYLPEALREAR